MTNTTNPDELPTDTFVTEWAKTLQRGLDCLAAADPDYDNFDSMPWTIIFPISPADFVIDPSLLVCFRQVQSLNKLPTIIYKNGDHAGLGYLREFRDIDVDCEPVNDLRAFVSMIMTETMSNGRGDNRFAEGSLKLSTLNRNLESLIHPIGL